MRFSKSGLVVCLGSLMLAGTSHVAAQRGNDGQLNVGVLNEKMQQELQRQAALKAIAADRAGAVNDIMLAHSDEANALYGDGWRDELFMVLMQATPEQVLAAQSARTYKDLVNTLFRQKSTSSATATGGALSVAPQVLGDDATDLVYFPVAPCRILDTRVAGGVFVNGTKRIYLVNGNMTAQGGSATGCGIPVDPAAVAITLTVTQPVGIGYLTALPHNGAIPNASTINFNNGNELANTTIVPVCQICGFDIDIVAGTTGSTHVVADIVGYFWSPNASPLASTVVSTTTSQTGIFDFNSPACPAGYTYTGGGHNWQLGNTDVWFWQTSPDVTTGPPVSTQCRGLVNRGGATSNITCYAVCSQVPGR